MDARWQTWYLQARPDESPRLLLEVSVDEMETVSALVVQKMEQVHPLDVPLTVTVNVDKNWMAMEEVMRPDRAE